MTDVPVLALCLGVAAAAFAALWPLSLRLRDASLVDVLWAPGFVLQAGVAAALAPAGWGVHGALLLGLLAVWAARLGATLVARRIAAGGEDPRYRRLRAAREPGFWWKSLFMVFLLQAVVQWLIVAGPLGVFFVPAAAAGALALAGVLLALAGLAIEGMADLQLDRFRRTHAPGALCDTGLRAVVRHPNYSGEMMFWGGIGLVAADAGAVAGLAAPVLVTLLLAFVSGRPILDEHMGETRPGWAAYRARVPAFVPRLNSRLSAELPRAAAETGRDRLP